MNQIPSGGIRRVFAAAMRRRTTKAAKIAVLMFAGLSSTAHAQTAFTYQGKLSDASGQAASGMHDLRFTLYTDVAGGLQLGSVLCTNDIAVADDGTFTTVLDFGSQFVGSIRYLAVEVRADAAGAIPCSTTTGFTVLSPRQPVNNTPQASYASTAGTAASATNASTLGGQSSAFYTNAGNLTAGTIPSARLSGTYASILSFTSAANQFIGNGAGLTSLNATNLNNGTLADARLSSNVPRLNTANTFTATSTFPSLGIGVSPTFPFDLSTPNQGVMNLVGSHIGGSWINLRNSSGSGRTWNMIVAGSDNAEPPGSLFFRDASTGVRMLIDTAGNVGLGTSLPLARIDIRSADPAAYIKNNNDTGGGFALSSFGALQFGLFNPTASAWNTVPANGRRSYFGISSLGTVGSLTNTTNSPTFRNILDDGAGAASIAGDLTVNGNTRINSQFAIGGSVGGESLRVYGPILQDQDTNGPGFLTLTSSRTNGPELHLVNSQATGKNIRLRSIGSGATAAFTIDNFTDSRELLRITRLGTASFPNGGLTVNGRLTAADGFEMDGDNANVYINDFTPYISVSSGATGTSPGTSFFQDGYGGGTSLAAQFTPDVSVTRNLTATSIAAGVKLFEIDHPLDPDNKTLRHACIESDQMVNLYRGNVVLDEGGRGVVSMPDWFEALNTDYAYVLTPIGGWAPLYVESELKDGAFIIAGGQPGLKVSWQVTGLRHDEFAVNNPLEVERTKAPADQGKRMYRYPATGAEMNVPKPAPLSPAAAK